VKTRHKLALWATLLGLAAAPSFAYVEVTGIARAHWAYEQYGAMPYQTQVKFCTQPNGTGECYYTFTNTSYGSYSVTLREYQTYYAFVSYDADDWGSTSTHAWSNGNYTGAYYTQLNVYGGDIYGFPLFSEPRPHRPSAVYPPNRSENIPLVFTLKWTSGIDTPRNWPGEWPVTYDIYAYGEGGSELKVLADIPCNPDYSGNCTYYIDNVVPDWLYYWRVVAKLRVTPGNRIFQQSSPYFTFRTQP
jgi:hypothetical protein